MLNHDNLGSGMVHKKRQAMFTALQVYNCLKCNRTWE